MTEIPSKLIRAAADGELDDAGRQALEAAGGLTDPTLSRQLAFERELRHRVSSALEGVAAPASLADRIRAEMAAADLTTPAAEEPADPETPETLAPDVLGRVTATGAETRRGSWLTGPTRASALAVAAVLVFIVGAVLVGIFGPTIDSLPNNGPALIARAGQFASEEHIRCSAADTPKILWTNLAAAQRNGSNHLQTSIWVPDLTALGFNFRGGGRCMVPGGRASAHFMYAHATKPMQVSIFVVPDVGQFDDGISPDIRRWQWFPSTESTSCAHDVLACSTGQVIYLVACCSNAETPDITAFMLEQRPQLQRPPLQPPLQRP